MPIWQIILWSVLASGALVALLFAGIRLNRSSQRMSRSIDPINQKAKGLKLEVSGLKHSRLERQRRLVTSRPTKKRK